MEASTFANQSPADQSPTSVDSDHIASEAKSPLELLDSFAARMRYHRGQEICRPGHRVDSWYRVTAGAAGKCILQADGRRRIVDLLLPGDFFGFGTEMEHRHLVEAVVENTVIASYPRRRAEMLADTNSEVARAIREMAFAAIARAESQILILGQMSALEKVGTFLLTMVERLSSRARDEVTLPVSRCEMADYLAISAETVSRSLTGLKHRGAIALGGVRKVKILDRETFEDAVERMH
ncbi:transcriptional regulator, Crp/Fnr family [Rhizobiales bacterium GAS113]|nr:transcriptional regulator, Crp/Fnr family [Rhizobiales bacterium GAS113]